MKSEVVEDFSRKVVFLEKTTTCGQIIFVGGPKMHITNPRWRKANARPCPRSIYSKQLSRGQNRYAANADGVDIGATWRIRLNRPCAAAMWPYVKLL